MSDEDFADLAERINLLGEAIINGNKKLISRIEQLESENKDINENINQLFRKISKIDSSLEDANHKVNNVIYPAMCDFNTKVWERLEKLELWIIQETTSSRETAKAWYQIVKKDPNFPPEMLNIIEKRFNGLEQKESAS